MDIETNISTSERGERELPDFCLLRPLTRLSDPKVIEQTWEKIRTQDYAFDDFTINNPGLFLAGMVNENTYYFLVEDAGIVILNDLYENSTSSNIHFCMWDKKYPHSKIIQAAKEALGFVFSLNCHRVTALIPNYNPFAKRLATQLRFRYEGCMKEAILYKGKWYDEDIFGLLHSNFIKPEVQ
jgi:RimJ/RimL family protein N-acetyltransferase